MRLRAAGVLLLSFTPTLAAQQVRDSAGVRSYIYGADDRAAERWRIEPRPLLSIGGVSGEGATEFANVAGIARLSDGSLVVADASSQELRLFDVSGRFTKRVGRRGQGPGEFDGLRDLARVADTVGGVDGVGRVQLYAPGGTLLRSLARPQYRTPSLGFQLGWFSDWSLLAAGFPTPSDPMASRQVAPMILAHVDYRGGERVLDTVPGFEVVRTGGGPPLPVQFGPAYRAVALGDRYCGGHQQRFEITCHDKLGRPLARTIRSVTAGALPEEAREYFRTTTLRGNASLPADMQAKLREMIRQTHFAERASAFGRLLAGTTGELWVAPFDYRTGMMNAVAVPTSNAPHRWSVIGRDGRWLAEVDLPPNFGLVEAGQDYVAGVMRDEDDVESVVLYRLFRR